MNAFQSKISEWSLRFALAGTYVYSGLDLVRHPTAWYWALRPLPDFFQRIISAVGTDRYLQLQGASELAFAVVFLAWFLPSKIVRIFAALAAFEMIAILLMVGINGETFRDIGILGAAAGLFFLIKNPHDAMPNL